MSGHHAQLGADGHSHDKYLTADIQNQHSHLVWPWVGGCTGTLSQAIWCHDGMPYIGENCTSSSTCVIQKACGSTRCVNDDVSSRQQSLVLDVQSLVKSLVRYPLHQAAPA